MSWFARPPFTPTIPNAWPTGSAVDDPSALHCGHDTSAPMPDPDEPSMKYPATSRSSVAVPADTFACTPRFAVLPVTFAITRFEIARPAPKTCVATWASCRPG